MKTSNAEHLSFIYDRLINVHGENPQYDYMIRLKEIIEELDPTINENPSDVKYNIKEFWGYAIFYRNAFDLENKKRCIMKGDTKGFYKMSDLKKNLHK